MTAEDISRILPHRYPFVAVDRVVEVVPGKRAVALKTVTSDAAFTGGAARHLSPEVMVLEAMAQVGALAFAATLSDDAAGPEAGIFGYLAGLNDVTFHIRPRVGDTLELTLEYVAGIGQLARFRGTARISGETAVEAGLTFTVERQK